MKKILCFLLIFAVLPVAGLLGCAGSKKPKIGISFGVGPAARWKLEQDYMVAKAQSDEIGAEVLTRYNTDEAAKPQFEDCKELIDSGIDVLIYIQQTGTDAKKVLDYAREKKVKVISYARVVQNYKVDLLVGYDSKMIGQMMGKYLVEYVYSGDYIILRGDSGDNNAKLLYDGAMGAIDKEKDINIVLDAEVKDWNPATAKQLVKEAVQKNGGKVDAIFAPNDKIAGGCAEALAEFGVTDPVYITGMDAELAAAKRIVAGTQSMTVYMDLKILAETAIIQAAALAKGQKAQVNSQFDVGNGVKVDANLISGKEVTKQNLDSILIDSGYFTREQVYND